MARGDMGYDALAVTADAEILNRTPFEGVSMTIDFTGVTATADNGKKIVKAGTPIAADGVVDATAYDIDDLADVIFVGDDAAPGVTLLAEEDQLAHGEVADGDAVGVEQFAAHTVAALAARGFLFGHGSSLISV